MRPDDSDETTRCSVYRQRPVYSRLPTERHRRYYMLAIIASCQLVLNDPTMVSYILDYTGLHDPTPQSLGGADSWHSATGALRIVCTFYRVVRCRRVPYTYTDSYLRACVRCTLLVESSRYSSNSSHRYRTDATRQGSSKLSYSSVQALLTSLSYGPPIFTFDIPTPHCPKYSKYYCLVTAQQ